MGINDQHADYLREVLKAQTAANLRDQAFDIALEKLFRNPMTNLDSWTRGVHDVPDFAWLRLLRKKGESDAPTARHLDCALLKPERRDQYAFLGANVVELRMELFHVVNWHAMVVALAFDEDQEVSTAGDSTR